MSTSNSSPSFFRRPANAVVLVLIAVAAWGFNAWQRSQAAPVQGRIDAGARYLQQGQGPAAEREWKEAARLDPQNVEAWTLLSDYYWALGNIPEAQKSLQHLLKLQPDTPEIHYRLAFCAAQLGDKKAANGHAQQHLKVNPNHVGTLDILSTILTQSGEDEARLKYLRRLVEVEPQNDVYLARLADGLFSQKQYAEARPILDRLLKLKPAFGRAHSLRGAALFYTDASAQGLASAIEDLNEALRQEPNNTVARLYLAKTYLKLRRPKDAIIHLNKLKRLHNAPTAYLFELSRAHQMQGNSQEALNYRRRYAALEQHQVAVERLQSRLANNPRDFEATLELGLMLLRSEKPAGADGYLKKAAQLRPSDARAKKALQESEQLFGQHLAGGAQALKRRDYDKMAHHLSYAMMLRPYDARTTRALQKFQAATVTQSSAGAGDSKNSTAPMPPMVPNNLGSR